jgi:hypothetical protein
MTCHTFLLNIILFENFGLSLPFALILMWYILRRMYSFFTSYTQVIFDLITWQYIPEDSELHIRRRENLKSHKVIFGSPTHY